MNMNKLAVAAKYEGVELDINKRWENGTDHHPKSLEIFSQIEELDYHFQNDFFCWKSGGAGDNGEFLMYLLDIIFEKQDKEEII